MKTKFEATILLFVLLFLAACSDNPVPKPVGFFRIDIPAHGFIRFEKQGYPYSMEYADYANVVEVKNEHPYWIDVVYPRFKAKIYISYLPVDTALSKYINDCYTMTYKHTSKAIDIESEPVLLDSSRVYGLIYYISGNDAASPINFYLTDSTRHFVRGALYFNMEPRNDSLQPVIQGIERDIKHMINTWQWTSGKP